MGRGILEYGVDELMRRERADGGDAAAE